MSSVAWILGLILVVIVTFGIGSGTNEAARTATFIFFPAAITLYFAPSIVAFTRGRPNAVSILLLNLFVGWTLVGWVAALVWAHSSTAPAPSPAIARPADAAVSMKACEFCAEPIRAEAKVCRYCGRDTVPNASVAT